MQAAPNPMRSHGHPHPRVPPIAAPGWLEPTCEQAELQSPRLATTAWDQTCLSRAISASPLSQISSHSPISSSRSVSVILSSIADREPSCPPP